MTAATKSGTNEFKGEAFYRYTDEDMRAKTPAERREGKSKEVSAEKEYGFAPAARSCRTRHTSS